MKKRGNTILFSEPIKNLGNAQVNLILSAVTMALSEDNHVLIIDSSDYYMNKLLVGHLETNSNDDLQILLDINDLNAESLKLYSDVLIEKHVSYVRSSNQVHINNIIRYGRDVFDYIYVLNDDPGQEINHEVEVVNLPKDLIRIKEVLKTQDTSVEETVYVLGEHNPGFRHENIKRLIKSVKRELITLSGTVNAELSKAINDQNVIDYIIGNYNCKHSDDNYHLFCEIDVMNKRISGAIEYAILGGPNEV